MSDSFFFNGTFWEDGLNFYGLLNPCSKAGRPPTRKLSDRKAYTRQKHTAIAAADFLGTYSSFSK